MRGSRAASDVTRSQTGGAIITSEQLWHENLHDADYIGNVYPHAILHLFGILHPDVNFGISSPLHPSRPVAKTILAGPNYLLVLDTMVPSSNGTLPPPVSAYQASYTLSLRFKHDTTCHDYTPAYITLTVVHVAADIIILSIPITLLIHLRVPTRKKYVGLVLVFLGGLATCCSGVKAAFAVIYARSTDISFIASRVAHCAHLETSLAIVASSLPQVRLLWTAGRHSSTRYCSSGTMTGDRNICPGERVGMHLDASGKIESLQAARAVGSTRDP